MILRSQIWLEESQERPNTIDIEFWGIDYLDLPTLFRGISIEIESAVTCPKGVKHQSKGSKLLKITSEGEVYYVIAAGCIVGTSNWMLRDRLTDLSLKYDEILMKL
ncbi:MAG: hypothetical protein RL329_2518 [Bacteroidota bacterium]